MRVEIDRLTTDRPTDRTDRPTDRHDSELEFFVEQIQSIVSCKGKFSVLHEGGSL